MYGDFNKALVDLVKACDKFRDVDGVAEAISAAIDVLGYDPLNVVKDYTVSLIIDTEATSISEAVRNAMSMIDNNPSELWSYIVEDSEGNKAEIGGWEANH